MMKGMPGKNSRVQNCKYVLFKKGLLSVTGEKNGKNSDRLLKTE